MDEAGKQSCFAAISAARRSRLMRVIAGLTIVMACDLGAVDAWANSSDVWRDARTGDTTALKMAPPEGPATACTADEFTTIAIRIGFHASLQACYHDIQSMGRQATAFVTIPREFDNKSIDAEQFTRLRGEIARSETAQFKKSQLAKPTKSRQAAPGAEPAALPLGVFDNNAGRIGYAYAFGVEKVDQSGHSSTQAMMRTETFVHVRDKVVVVMIIAPVQGSESAAVLFELSERWAQAIVAANVLVPRGWSPTVSKPQMLGATGDRESSASAGREKLAVDQDE